MPNMLIDPKLILAIDQVLECLPLAISDIEQRKDYAINPQLAQDVSCLKAFKQQLILAKNDPSLPSVTSGPLRNKTNNSVLPMLKSLIAANLEMSQMGLLNLKRTIEPKYALTENAKLEVLQQASQTLAVCLAK